jgi:hypothetical protein
MEASRIPQPVHARDETSPAPEDLELLRSFLSLHDHEPGNPDSLPPTAESLRWWLKSKGLIRRQADARGHDLDWGLHVKGALTAKVRENMGEPRDPAAIELLNRAARETGLRPCFGCPDDVPIHVDTGGVRGAIGTLLGAAFLAELDERWSRFRVCNDSGCSSVFYDRSKNRTGKWCSMSSCGNRAKVRAFRERKAGR